MRRIDACMGRSTVQCGVGDIHQFVRTRDDRQHSDVSRLLSRLTNLDLHSNAIVGVIPSSFGFLDRLQSLRLDSNSLSGRVPSAICNNKEITSINLAGNLLSCYEPCLSSIATANFEVAQCTSGHSLSYIVMKYIYYTNLSIVYHSAHECSFNCCSEQ